MIKISTQTAPEDLHQQILLLKNILNRGSLTKEMAVEWNGWTINNKILGSLWLFDRGLLLCSFRQPHRHRHSLSLSLSLSLSCARSYYLSSPDGCWWGGLYWIRISSRPHHNRGTIEAAKTAAFNYCTSTISTMLTELFASVHMYCDYHEEALPRATTTYNYYTTTYYSKSQLHECSPAAKHLSTPCFRKYCSNSSDQYQE